MNIKNGIINNSKYSFKECLDMLADGEINILGSVSYTQERAESIDMSILISVITKYIEQ